MSIYERQCQIMNFLKEHQFSTVKELAKLVYSSEASVRRDIKQLANQGYLCQVYGGVTLPEYKNHIIPLNVRDNHNSNVKEQIAKRATEEIFDGATIIMDDSSTVRRMIKYIKPFSQLTIITNNIRIFNEEIPSNVTLYCTGGLFMSCNEVFVGAGAKNYLNGINADILFFSSQAVSDDGEISDPSEEETEIHKVMLTRAKKKIFLCDSTKLGRKRTFTVCTKDDVDMIICDQKLPWEQ